MKWMPILTVSCNSRHFYVHLVSSIFTLFSRVKSPSDLLKTFWLFSNKWPLSKPRFSFHFVLLHENCHTYCTVPRSRSLTLKSCAPSNQSDFWIFGHILKMPTLTKFGNKFGPRWRHHHFCSKLEFWAEICFDESFLEENDL